MLAKVLALVSDHVDLLLEDWYPSLGKSYILIGLVGKKKNDLFIVNSHNFGRYSFRAHV